MSAALLCEVFLYSKQVETKVNVGNSTCANWVKCYFPESRFYAITNRKNFGQLTQFSPMEVNSKWSLIARPNL